MNLNKLGFLVAIREIVEINKVDVIDRMAEKMPHLNHDLVAKSVNAMLDQMVATLAEGGRIELRGFGSFSISKREPRKGRNPKTGQSVMVESRYVPRFKPGQTLRKDVDS